MTQRHCRHGQISIDYIAGAMVFFGAVLFLVSSVLNTVPQFTANQEISEAELTAWGMTEVLLHDEGWWAIGNANGTDWQTDAHISGVEVVGLRTGDDLSPAKLDAFLSLNYATLKDAFGTDMEFSIDVNEFVPVDTYRRFTVGADPPDYLTPPGDLAAGETVHYGSFRVDGAERYVLLADQLGWYNKLYVSGDWDFTSSTVHNLTETQLLQVQDAVYRAPAANTQVSDGKLLVLEREIDQVGAIPDESVGNIVAINRFAAGNDRIFRFDVQVWRPA